MSLILDALRKSEAERRRGQSPDLFAATPGGPSNRRERPRVWPLLLLGAMLLASAWLIWTSGPERSDDLPSEVPPAPVLAPTEVSPPTSARAPVRPAPPPPIAETQALTAAPDPATTPDPAVEQAPPARESEPLPPPVESAEPDLPPLAILDAGTRAALPPLKLSMHVYADEPSRRFAIVDGQRVAEGATLGTGVVAEIRRDGVVIEVDGRRVLLPKP